MRDRFVDSVTSRREVLFAAAITSAVLFLPSFSIASTPAIIAAAEREGKVVIFTNALAERMASQTQAFQKLYPKIKVEVFRDLSTTIETKFLAEVTAGRVQADLIDIASIAAFQDWKSKKYLMEYRSPTYDHYDTLGLNKGWHEPGFYTVKNLFTLRPVVNTKIVPKKDIAGFKDWKDIVDYARKRKLRIITGDVERAAGAYQFYYVMRKAGQLDLYKELMALRPELSASNGAKINKAASGETPIVFDVIDEYFIPELAKGVPLQGIWPASGAVVYPQLLGITAQAPHPNAAKLFFDWLLSKDGQQAMANAGDSSARRDVTPGPGLKARSNLKILGGSIDFTDVESVRKSWTEDFKRFAN